MIKKNNYAFTVGITLVITLLLSAYGLYINANAQTTQLPSSNNSTTNVNITPQMCQQAVVKLQTVAANFRTKQAEYDSRYSELMTKLNAAQAKLQERGINTTELRTKINGLKPLLDKFTTDADAFATKLEGMQGYNCNQSSQVHKQTLERLMTDAALVTSSVNAITNYYTNEIRPLLEALQTQIRSSLGTSR